MTGMRGAYLAHIRAIWLGRSVADGSLPRTEGPRDSQEGDEPGYHFRTGVGRSCPPRWIGRCARVTYSQESNGGRKSGELRRDGPNPRRASQRVRVRTPRYGSSCSVVLSADWSEMWVKPEPAVAPCQCFSPLGMRTVSPSPTSTCSASVVTSPLPLVM